MVAPQVRADSWAALLKPEQQWALFDFHYQTAKGKWELSCAWAEKEFELSRRPSRAGFYTWLGEMRKLDSIRHQEIRTLADERINEAAKDIALDDPKFHRAILAEAMSQSLVLKDPEAGSKYMTMVSNIVHAAMRQKELELRGKEVELKQQAEKRKDEELALAREKFEAAERRLQAVQDAVDKAKGGKIDPARVADEIDKILGRKK